MPRRQTRSHHIRARTVAAFPAGLDGLPETILPSDNVLAFDFADGRCLGPIVEMPKLNGQAIAFFA